ncbi:MAG: hypothetical protein JW888_08635, partial [Pirellulales bacterium]|nr:hypothetical protein [Pirellulales bacterium]
MPISKRLLLVVFLLGLAAITKQATADQPPVGVAPAPSVVSGAYSTTTASPVMPATTPAPPDSKESKPTEKSDKEAKSDDKKDKKDKDKDKGKKDSEEPKTVSRPTEPAEPPDPEELKVRPDSHGLVKLNFKGQPWPAVLEWLAEISNMSLDWQEAPSGYLNLTTQRPYTVEETRDEINRLLLMRGFTLLYRGEVMSLVNIAKLNPSMVPRVAPDELDQRPPHEFVKVSFRLEHLLAETAAEELKPYLSPHNGKLTPMQATNRLEAMDAVINLREIRTLLSQEQSVDNHHRPPWVRKLQHRRASEVVKHLKTLLGISSGSSAVPMTPQQMQEAQQAAMRAQQQGKKSGKSAQSKP